MIALAFAALLQQPADVQSGLCQRALAAAPAYSICTETPHGVALAMDQANADALARHASAGEARFQTYFARNIAPYAVTSSSTPLDRGALETAGFVHVLPWPDPEAFDRARRQGIEAAARQFASSQGLGAVQADQLVARALANGGAEGGKAALDAGMLPHELGHLWFTQAFWPAAGQGDEGDEGVSHYGGPGPDWLDELAAILLEDGPTTDRRRAQMQLLLRGEVVPTIGPVAGRDALLDLKGFLSRAHPALARVQMAPPNLPAGGGVALVYTPAGGAPSAAAQERLFYIQARAFADFLIDKTGRPTVFADIAQALAEERTFEAWLSTDGAALGLPDTIDGLDRLWREGR
ncbi:hypothetical protein [Brevundimonas sp.]|uniref:hypothetical protein n=1 Tax=Brevundimonas sp. TaxID=1871086 RepID=UPI003D139304